MIKACKDSEGLKAWQRYGTPMVVSWVQEVGALPTRNFSTGAFEEAPNLYGEAMRQKIVLTDKGCFGCPSPCGKYSYTRRHGVYVEGPEYETSGMLGSDVGLGDIEDVAYANYLADELGIDTNSVGGVIAFTMDCFERGLIGPQDVDGLDCRFGNREAVFTLIQKIARREGVGNLLAEGTKRAAQVWGKGAEDLAVQVKGMEVSAYACHRAPSMLLAYMTCDVGAHHNRAWAITYDIQTGRDTITLDKAERVIFLQHIRPLFDALGACRLQWVELGLDYHLYAPAHRGPPAHLGAHLEPDAPLLVPGGGGVRTRLGRAPTQVLQVPSRKRPHQGPTDHLGRGAEAPGHVLRTARLGCQRLSHPGKTGGAGPHQVRVALALP